MVLEYAVALAGSRFKAGDVGEPDICPAVVDQVVAFELSHGKSDRGPLHAKHDGEKVLRERHVVAAGAIGAKQEPPG